MPFDPTIDYGERDMSVGDNLLCWQFGELVKTLITLSSEAEKQFEIIGAGAVAEEMAEDFYSYYSEIGQTYLDTNMLTAAQKTELDELDQLLDIRSGGKAPDFWDDSQFATHPDWVIVRQKAKAILQLLGMDDLSIEFEREEKYENRWFRKRLMMQSTKTWFVKKGL